MKILIAIAVLLFFITGITPAQLTDNQTWLTVEARRRIYNSDGTTTYRPYEPFKTRTVSLLPGYRPADITRPLSRWGGCKEKQVAATGFFHVVKVGKRWWCVDPEGYLSVNIALNSISMGGSPNNRKALAEKFGTADKWIGQTIGMLQENGFNCAGSWSDYNAIIEDNRRTGRSFAYTINLNFMSSYGRERGGTFQQPGHTGYPGDAIFVFDPGWEEFCDRHARQIAVYKDDPDLFGYFSDNEMPFRLKSLDNYLSLPEGDPGNIAARKWLQEKGITKEQITDREREIFMALVAERYFSAVSKALKKYDPNHMYIGARFYSSEKNYPMFMRCAGKYADIISNNYYGKWTPDSSDMSNWTKWSGRPFIITEYYTKGEDSGMPNKSGAGWIVKTQRDRGLFYQNYNLALLESGNCVGWHYFKYQDNDPEATGVDPSNTDANKGIVNNNYDVWSPMMELMKELNTHVYDLIEYFDNLSPPSRKPIIQLSWKQVATGMPEGWYGSAESILVASNVLLYQRNTGGWPKNLPLHKPLTESEKAKIAGDKSLNDAIFDNSATTTEMRFLARMYNKSPVSDYKDAFNRGLKFILDAQYNNGGWPMIWPLRKGYYTHITFNDDAIVNILKLLREINDKDPLFIKITDKDLADRARGAYNRGIECILKTQIRVDGIPTVWSAQHDENTLLPAMARSYELSSFSGGESVGIVLFLMQVPDPSPEIVISVEGAVRWLDSHRIRNTRWEYFINSDGQRDRRIISDPAAGDLWARFYDLETGLPYVCDRDGIKKKTLEEIGYERRNGYSWHTDSPKQVIDKYPEWKAKLEMKKLNTKDL